MGFCRRLAAYALAPNGLATYELLLRSNFGASLAPYAWAFYGLASYRLLLHSNFGARFAPYAQIGRLASYALAPYGFSLLVVPWYYLFLQLV